MRRNLRNKGSFGFQAKYISMSICIYFQMYIQIIYSYIDITEYTIIRSSNYMNPTSPILSPTQYDNSSWDFPPRVVPPPWRSPGPPPVPRVSPRSPWLPTFPPTASRAAAAWGGCLGRVKVEICEVWEGNGWKMLEISWFSMIPHDFQWFPHVHMIFRLKGLCYTSYTLYYAFCTR